MHSVGIFISEGDRRPHGLSFPDFNGHLDDETCRSSDSDGYQSGSGGRCSGSPCSDASTSDGDDGDEGYIPAPRLLKVVPVPMEEAVPTGGGPTRGGLYHFPAVPMGLGIGLARQTSMEADDFAALLDSIGGIDGMMG